MKAYCYIQENSNIFVVIPRERSREELVDVCKSCVPKGLPFYLLSDEDVDLLGSTHPDDVSFEGDPDGYGGKE